MSGPLEGIRILDITSVIMGPFATSILADLGAEVIKVELPAGDVGRRLGPSRNDRMSALTLNLHRNKKSVVLDPSQPEGRAELAELLRGADAVVTNLRPASRERLGLDYPSLRALSDALVLCTAQAYSSGSSRRDAPAYDDIIQAASGMCDIYRRVHGEPRFAPSVIADKVCGMAIVNALLAALLHRGATGEGQWVDVPMVDTMVAFNLVEHLSGSTFVPPEGGVGWSRTMVPERKPLPASDGWVCVMPYSDRDWHEFFTAVGRAEVLDDPRFATNGARHVNAGPLQEILAGIVATRSVADWLALCDDLGVAVTEMLDLDRLQESPYLSERHMVTAQDHPSEGTYLNVRFPADFSRTPVDAHRPAPRLGEDNGARWRERRPVPHSRPVAEERKNSDRTHCA